jgi:kynurenine formamidase
MCEELHAGEEEGEDRLRDRERRDESRQRLAQQELLATDRRREHGLAHTLLLGAGIPVVEHLTGLEQLPPAGAVFTAVPLRIQGLGTIPVRAFARRPS